VPLLLNIADILSTGAQNFAGNRALEDLQENSISYKDLERAAGKIKELLVKQGISFGSRVGILLPKSIECVSAIFGILKAEAAYVPLDCKAPAARNILICRDCQLSALFIDKNLLPSLQENGLVNEKHTAIPISDRTVLLVFKENKVRHQEELAYILYTSGSTGVPKGVKHTHSSALTFIKWGKATFKATPSDRFLSHAPFHFDLSVFDLFVSMYAGATLVLTDERTATNPLALAEALSKKKISVFYTTPSVLSYLAAFGKMYKYDHGNLAKILFAGEVFPVNNLRALKNLLPRTTFFNLYGPTETNVCTWFGIPTQVAEHRKEPFPIGKTCAYADFALVNIAGCKNGEGELWIAGTSLMNGYWNDNAKTDVAFETDVTGELWYRTGDIVCKDRNGDLQYLRRKDRMVKRNSYRIELDEIEKHLARHAHILEAAVTANSPNGQTGTLITAHIAWHKEKEIPTMDLLAYCNSLMPSWMIPDKFEFYESLPKTSTDKINYVALTKP